MEPGDKPKFPSMIFFYCLSFGRRKAIGRGASSQNREARCRPQTTLFSSSSHEWLNFGRSVMTFAVTFDFRYMNGENRFSSIRRAMSVLYTTRPVITLGNNSSRKVTTRLSPESQNYETTIVYRRFHRKRTSHRRSGASSG